MHRRSADRHGTTEGVCLSMSLSMAQADDSEGMVGLLIFLIDGDIRLALRVGGGHPAA